MLYEESISYTEKEVAELLSVSISVNEVSPHIKPIENHWKGYGLIEKIEAQIKQTAKFPSCIIHYNTGEL